VFEALSNKITVGGDTQGGVMMEPQPTSALVMGKTELLLELLVVPLNAPAHLGDEDQLLRRGVGRGPSNSRFRAPVLEPPNRARAQ
jgi:hypothetical protein